MIAVWVVCALSLVFAAVASLAVYSEDPGLVVFGFMLAGLELGGLFAARSEQRRWNGGVCRTNGTRWEIFDVDSQRGRGYRAGDEVLWVSYPVDRLPHRR